MNTMREVSNQMCEDDHADSSGHVNNFLDEWLEETPTHNNHPGYTHRLLRERSHINREQIKDQLIERVKQAHEDARRHLRKIVTDTLDPLGVKSIDLAQGYPEQLPLKSLKGYFGEIFAAMIAEEYTHFDISGWRVPAYSFRFHQTAFDYLERVQQGANVPTAVVGRTGDDMLAFAMGSHGQITHVLVCEAKCSNDHDSSLIAKAHEQVSDSLYRPVEIWRLIEVLRDYDDSESKAWRTALGLLYSSSNLTQHKRYDLVCYVCGRTPKQKKSWIPADAPHCKYSGGRDLEAAEIHISGVDQLISKVYGKGDES